MGPVSDFFDIVGGFLGLGFNLAWAVVVLLLALVFSRWLRRRTRRFLERRRVDANTAVLVDNLIKLAVVIVAGALALGFLVRDLRFLLTSLGLTVAALFLVLQDILKNIVAGFYLLAERPFRLGDRIAVGGVVGRVEQVDVRATVLRDDRGQQVLVPNIKVFSEVVVNDGARPLTPLLVVVDGVDGSPDCCAAAVRGVVSDLGWPTEPPPDVAVVKEGPDGRNLRVTLWHPVGDPGIRTVVSAVRARLPEATVTLA